MVKSAYIHIPFCLSKCYYCSFISFTDTSKKLGYLFSLLKEIDYYYSGETLDTLYLGGGTPSLFSIDELKKILNKFNFQNTETTIEVNPDSVDREYLKGLIDVGFNRLSIGVQSFDDNILKTIGRRHSANQAIETVKTAQDGGFENISIDLIYGLPNQTIQDFERDLEIVNNLNIQHVSLYGLKIDEGCYFYSNYPNNLPDDDMQADMYELAISKLTNHKHYEVSNWGKESKHNLNYWKCGEYYGFGLAAHGYIDGVRYSNVKTLEEYLANPTAREFGEFLTKERLLEEKIFLGLRIADGININEINEEFEIDFESKYKNIIEKYISTNHLIKTDIGYKFSDSGFLVSNIILADFV